MTVGEQQAAEVARVKRFEAGVLRDPITIPPTMKIRDVIKLTEQYGISGFPVVEGKTVVGIITNRDLRFERELDAEVRAKMTPRDKLVYVMEGAEGADRDEAKCPLGILETARSLQVENRSVEFADKPHDVGSGSRRGSHLISRTSNSTPSTWFAAVIVFPVASA